ncbi:MAG: RNA 2',3'-cyclic phosphodiesterase [Planctomycetes bacterium]|nr:RNA 2',3'-cyclic phosphodiesterase [Planctomycetota bacterium]
MIRTFVAIDLDDAVRKVLGALQGRLIAGGARLRWVEPEAIHLTLKFLGDIPPLMVPEVEECLRLAASSTAPFAFSIEGVGAFPRPSTPRVVWAGVRETSGALRELHGQVEEAMRNLDLPREDRAYTPHLTLGRSRGPRGGRPMDSLLAAEARFRGGEQEVEAMVLYQSDLGPGAPFHTRLATVPLGGG